MEGNNMALANVCDAYRKLIRLKDIIVEDNYQRPLKEEQVKKITENFKPYYFDDIKVSDRGDGTYACIDGNHHREAALRLFGENAFVWCRVINGLSEIDESKYFNELNSMQRRLSFNDSLRARYFAGEEKAVKYINLLERAGIKYSFSNGSKGAMVCHLKAMTVLSKYGDDVFLRTFKALSFSESKFKYHNCFIGAIAIIFGHINSVEIDDNRIRKAINLVSLSPNIKAVISNNSSGTGNVKNAAVVALASKICGEYNKHLGRSQRIPYEILSALL